MLLRDKVAKELLEAVNSVKDSEVRIEKLTSNEEFFQAIIRKIRSELDLLEVTRSIDNLAELMELIDWIQVALGTTDIGKVIENRAEKLGLYWDRYYIKDNLEHD